MKIKKLEWAPLDSHHGRAWIAIIKGLSGAYAVWIDRNSGQTIIVDPERARSTHNSIDDAKNWCQEDFEKKMKNLIEN